MFATTVAPSTTIRDWLVTRIADYTERAPHQLDPAVPLEEAVREGSADVDRETTHSRSPS